MQYLNETDNLGNTVLHTYLSRLYIVLKICKMYISHKYPLCNIINEYIDNAIGTNSIVKDIIDYLRTYPDIYIPTSLLRSCIIDMHDLSGFRDELLSKLQSHNK